MGGIYYTTGGEIRSTHHSNTLADAFAIRSLGRMPYVIIDTPGQALRDVAGDLIVLAAREEAARWTTGGERVEPYIPQRHDRQAAARRS